jgi:uncharacterized membrane protein YidH (DUF202 family)
MNRNLSEDEDALIVEQMQAILQEKRTALKIIRIGIAVVLAQAGAAGTVAAAFSRHAFLLARGAVDAAAVLGAVLLGVALYLVVSAIIRIRRLDRDMLKLERRRGERDRPGV